MSQRALPRLCYFFWGHVKTAHVSYLYCEQLRCQGACGETIKSKDRSYARGETQRERKGEGRFGSSTEVLLMTLPFCSQKLWACTWERVMCQGKLLCVKNLQLQSHHRFHFSIFLIFSGVFFFLMAFVKRKKKAFHSGGSWRSLGQHFNQKLSLYTSDNF